MLMRIEDGVAVKRGDEDVLARQAKVLAALRHPGVVELVGQARGELRTAAVDGPTLDALGPLPLHEAAGVVAAVAATVADLHSAGVAHGALEPSHILIGPDGGPVLCGFRRAGAIGSVGADGRAAEATDDVKALGELLDDLIPVEIAKGMSRPTHALRTLARVATHPNPDRRPTARELADAMTDEVHGACLPAPRARAAADPGDPAAVDPLDALRLTDDEDEPVRFPRVAAAAAVLLVLAGVGFGLRPSAAAKASAKAPAAAPSTTPTTVATALPVATRLPAPPPGCAVVTGPLKADIDGDGCDDGLRFDDGVLHAGPTRWAVGQKGDVVVTGSWGCAPAATLALLRPATGDVFAFGGWAASGHPTAAPLVGHVDGANGLRPDDTDGDGCDDLVVTRSTGDAVTLHPKVPA